jgi:tetratricopeptide (TPR) repeat protein
VNSEPDFGWSALSRAWRAHRSRWPALVLVLGAGAFAVRHRADIAAPDGARSGADASEPLVVPVQAVATGSPGYLPMSIDDARASCLAPVPADSRVWRALLASMKPALALPQRPEHWVGVGHAWMSQVRNSGDSGFALNAEACARVAQEIIPDHPGALGLIALVSLDAHDFARARELAESVIARDPHDAGALGTLSDAALELGDVPEARDSAQRLMDLAPGLGAYARASYLRWLHGDEAGALELARLAIDAAGDPNDLLTRAWALVQAASLFWHKGDHDGADAGYRMALQVRRDYAPALVGRGKVAAARGNSREAADFFTAALAAHADVETASLLGDTLRQLGDEAGATRQDALAEQIGRHDRRGLALHYANRRIQPERAVQLARAELQGRGDIYTEDALAWALYADGQFAEAAQHSDRALRLGTLDASLLYHQGAIRLALGDVGRAKGLLDRALQQNPGFDASGAKDARRLLELAGS